MKDLSEVLLGEIEVIDDLVESLQGFCSCVGYAGSHTDESYIKMVMGELTSLETVRIMERIDGICGVLPHANNLSRGYEEALEIAK
ncbi:MAG: hypothetical protein ABH840_02205 [Nanoarchaeota archaeon]